MPINQFHATASPIDAIGKALGIAKDIYGIEHASVAQKALELQNQGLERKNAQEIAQQDELSNPESNTSKFEQASLGSALDFAAKKGIADQGSISQLKSLLIPSEGIANPETGDVSGANKGMSALQIASLKETNPLIKFVTGQQAAEAAASRANAIGVRTEEVKNQNSIHAGEAFEKDPIIKLSKTSVNSLNKSLSILDNPNKPVTTKDLNLAYNDYINAVAAGGTATEGKIQRELPETFAQDFNSLKGKFGQFDDLRKDPTGSQLVNMLKENISKVNQDMQQQISEQAKNIHANFGATTNPKVKQVADEKLNKYTSLESASPNQVQKRAVTADEINQYASKHGMDAVAASQFLKSQGYQVP